MEKIKFTIITHCYNGEQFIEKCIDSVKNQTYLNYERIIKDDGSTDKTIDIINNYKDKRIKLIDGPKKGVKQNFANAIKNCHGKYIFLSDQDDIWLEGKVKKILDTFAKEKCTCVVHDCEVFDSDIGNIIYDSFYKYRKSEKGIIKNILLIPNDIEMHDQWIGILSEKHGKSIFINNKFIKYRRHGDNVSEMKHYPLIKMIRNRLILLKNINRIGRKKCCTL